MEKITVNNEPWPARCNFCCESSLGIGQKTDYGAVIVYKIGDSVENSWFATLSPKTAGDPEKDFSLQLMPARHLINFSQMNDHLELAKNFGLAFSKLSKAVGEIIDAEEPEVPRIKKIIPLGSYGKCKHLNEHIHFKIFPWRSSIGQPYTVDSSFEKKEIHDDNLTGQQFVKMEPVKKVYLRNEKFKELSARFISLLNA